MFLVCNATLVLSIVSVDITRTWARDAHHVNINCLFNNISIVISQYRVMCMKRHSKTTLNFHLYLIYIHMIMNKT